MNAQKTAIRASSALIAFAIFLRLLGGGFFVPAAAALQNERLLSLLIFLETGRVVRLPREEAPTEPTSQTHPTEPAPPPQQPEYPKAEFSPEDVAAVPVDYGVSYRPDVQSLLLQPLDWNLRQEEPTVLIIHTHATEAYTMTENSQYAQDSVTRTLDERYNMVSIGDEVQRILEEAGIRVIHDRTFYDYPTYTGAYSVARKAITAALKQHPSITMVLDIHRDAMDSPDGSRLTTHATVDGLPSSQVMVLVGTDYSGSKHPDWQENLSVGLKIAALMERENPGVTKAVYLYPNRLNMDKTRGSLLLEVGASGDTHEQAIRAAGAAARAIAALASGS